VSGAEVDPARLEEEWAEDLKVLKNLADNGDRADLVRVVDVSFSGTSEAIDRLEADAEDLGFTPIDREIDEDGLITLFVEREQAADPASIKSLTITCLEIEARYGVEYDGWGCVAETGLPN
jgi:regulator of RNase E activity RraB